MIICPEFHAFNSSKRIPHKIASQSTNIAWSLIPSILLQGYPNQIRSDSLGGLWWAIHQNLTKLYRSSSNSSSSWSRWRRRRRNYRLNLFHAGIPIVITAFDGYSDDAFVQRMWVNQCCCCCCCSAVGNSIQVTGLDWHNRKDLANNNNIYKVDWV